MAEFMLLSIPWADRMNNFMTSLGFMGKGMGGILAVILLITLLAVLIMNCLLYTSTLPTILRV